MKTTKTLKNCAIIFAVQLFICATLSAVGSGAKELLFDGKIEALKKLVKNDKRIVNMEYNGGSLLHYAASNNVTDIIQLLVEQGADIEKKDKAGHTPLHLAILFNRYNAVELLIKLKANINAENNKKQTCLHLAMSNIQLIHDPINRLCIQKSLIKNGALLNMGSISITPLDLATYSGQEEIVLFLLKRGENMNCKNEIGYTPLHIAAMQGHTRITEMLLQYGADAVAKDSTGVLPIDYAVAKNHFKIAKLLLSADKRSTITTN